jgi:hypothetical protein
MMEGVNSNLIVKVFENVTKYPQSAITEVIKFKNKINKIK